MPAVVDVVLHDAKTGKSETLTCTPEHPLYVQGQGWVEAGSLGIGTSIVSRAGPALQVTDLTWHKNKAEELASGTGSSFGGYTVYNLTVDADHTFFVGTTGGGTWVHNSCPLFDKIGIDYTRHFANRLAQRGARGITDQLALKAYNRGRLFFNNASKNFIRHDSASGVTVVVDKASNGKAITVFEGNPSPDWTPVPWRPGSL